MTGSTRDARATAGAPPRRPEQEQGVDSVDDVDDHRPARPLPAAGPGRGPTSRRPPASSAPGAPRTGCSTATSPSACTPPRGPAAHAWITRALTAGGLATPALAMVYDASEGTGGTDDAPAAPPTSSTSGSTARRCPTGWPDGPLPEREARALCCAGSPRASPRRTASAWPSAASPPTTSCCAPTGWSACAAVPAASGTDDGDIAALGALLEVCLTGLAPASRAAAAHRLAPTSLALVRRARSTEPGHGLSSVAAMVALLAERPRTGPRRNGGSGAERIDRQRLDRAARQRRPPTGDRRGPSTVRLERRHHAAGAAPGPSPRRCRRSPGGDTVARGAGRPAGGAYAGTRTTRPPGLTAADDLYDRTDDRLRRRPPTATEPTARRHRLVVVGLPLLALALVVGLRPGGSATACSRWPATSTSRRLHARPAARRPRGAPAGGGAPVAAGAAVAGRGRRRSSTP